MINFFQKHRAETAISIGIFCVASAIRILYIYRGYDFDRDAVQYIGLVQNWVTNGIFPSSRICYFPFVFPFILAKTGFDVADAFVVQNVFLGCLIPVEFFLLLKCLHCHNFAAGAVGVLAAFHPSLIRYSCQPLRESSYLFVSLFVIGFLIRLWRYDKITDHLLFGVLAAVSFFCRLEGVVLCAFYLIVMWTRQVHSNHSWKAFVRHVLAAALSYAVVFALAICPVRRYVRTAWANQIHAIFKK